MFNHLQTKINLHYVKNSFGTPQGEECASIRETNWCLLYRAIIAVTWENYTYYKNTLCRCFSIQRGGTCT
jgi:hypothetical protein